MDAIQIMMEEHKNIKTMLKVIRKISFEIIKGKAVDYEEFNIIIDFVRNYADKHHHQKEEDFLFNKMAEELGSTGEKLVKNGMLVEHDLGRLYIRNLKEALKELKEGNEEAVLNVIANAISYSNHLAEHIRKEDNVIYTFAKRELKEETIERINKECEAFENNTEDVRNKYKEIVASFAKKYNIAEEI